VALKNIAFINGATGSAYMRMAYLICFHGKSCSVHLVLTWLHAASLTEEDASATFGDRLAPAFATSSHMSDPVLNLKNGLDGHALHL
jgi:hypothetical protein